MQHLVCRALTVCALLVLAVDSGAQTLRTEHTYALDDPENRPAATLGDVTWLVGSWHGEAFGGTFEEVWSPPSAGSMVGLFKLMHENSVSFYELLILVEEEGSLSLKVKHFNSDFTAWEDKEEYVNFRFVRAAENALHFSGISFYRIDDSEMHAWIAMRNGDEVREEKLVYRRASLTKTAPPASD